MRRATFKLLSVIIGILLIAFGVNAPVKAVTYGCNNFANQLCAPISTVTLGVGSGKSLIANASTTYISTKVSKLNFKITAGSENAAKTATLQFFDISSGLKLIVRSNADSSCAASNTIQKECAITLSADGTRGFYITLLDSEPGMHFQFKYVGPEAWTSATKSVTFSQDGKIPVTPDACAANNTQICGPVTNLSFKAKNKAVKISKLDKLGNFKSNLNSKNDLLKFTYKSNSAYAFKYIYVDFFNLTGGLSLIVDTSANSVGAGCDRSVANSRGCYMQLNSKGSATFIVTLSANSAGQTFSYKLNGAGYTSKYVVVSLKSKAK